MGKKGAKRKTRWRTLSIGTPPGEEDEEDGGGGPQRNGYLKSEQQRSPTRHAGKERNGYPQQQQQQQQPWLKSRHGSAGSSSNGGSSSGYASGESRHVASFNEDEYTKITTPRQDMLFKKGYLSQRRQLYASASATPSTAESQSASHSTADGSEAAEDQQLLDSGAPADYLPTAGTTVLEAAPPQLSYGTYYDHASGYYYEYPMMLVGPALPPDQMHHGLPCAAVPCAPVPLRPIEWVNPAFVPKLASQQYCYMDYQTQGAECAALVDAQGMPLSGAELALTNGLSNEASLTGSASASASGSVADDVDESALAACLPMLDHEMTELARASQSQPQPPIEVMPLEMVEQPEVVALPMDYAPAEAPPYVEPQPMPYLYPGQYMFGPPVVNVNGVTIQSGPMLRCSDMVASSAAAAAAVAKRRKKKKKKKQKRPHALGNTEDEDEEDYSSEGDTALSSPSRVPWPAATAAAAEATTATTTTTTSWPLNPECQEFHLPEAADASKESLAEPQPQLGSDLTRLTSEDERVDEAQEVVVLEEQQQQQQQPEEESVKPKTRRRSLKIVREPTPGPDLRDDAVADDGHEDEDEDAAEGAAEEALLVDERPVEGLSAMLVGASIAEAPRKDADVDAPAWHNESPIASESRRAAEETDSGFESQQSSGKSRPISDAVNEWLKRANSPDLFIACSATSDEEDEGHEARQTEDHDDQSKNLQGNPMPALSASGQAAHEQLAAAAAPGAAARKHRGKNRAQRRRRDRSEHSGKQDLAGEAADDSVRATDEPPGTTATGAELSVNKDSDAGMRVAEKTRITKLEDTSATQQSVKTYEKGEIVVSMDGELLLVETIVPARRDSSSSSSSSSSSESGGASLGSIEEPDLVLECWEPESVEPIVATPKKTAEEDKREEGAGHVQLYYRLLEDAAVEPARAAAPASPRERQEGSSEDEVVEVLVQPDPCVSFAPRALLPPVDEAFEVYESCYNGGKSLPYEGSSPFYSGDPGEGPIPCKANCCNVQ